MEKTVIRVAVNNNFNCTKAEFDQVKGFRMVYPNSTFFINSNIKTEKLSQVNKNDLQVVITVNPDVTVEKDLVKKLYTIDKSKVAFVRVKYIPNDASIKNLIKELSKKGYKVVITAMRFIGNESLNKFSSPEYYEYICSWFRLKKDAFAELENFADSLKNVFICDRKGLGCSGCGQCSMLVTGENLPVYSLNISCSGICKFNCVDCYAKRMQNVLKNFNKAAMIYDVVKMNDKQKGKTAHIQRNKTK